MYFSIFFNCTPASNKNTGNTKDKEYGVSRGIDFQGWSPGLYISTVTQLLIINSQISI
jgi:hypothetical protein